MGLSPHTSGSTMWLHYIWYQIKIRYQINTVPTPTVAWTRVWLLQGGRGVRGVQEFAYFFGRYEVQTLEANPYHT